MQAKLCRKIFINYVYMWLLVPAVMEARHEYRVTCNRETPAQVLGREHKFSAEALHNLNSYAISPAQSPAVQ